VVKFALGRLDSGIVNWLLSEDSTRLAGMSLQMDK